MVGITLLAFLPLFSGCRRGRHGKSTSGVQAPVVRAPLPDPGGEVLARALTLPYPEHFASEADAPASGGILKVHLDVEPPHLNPLIDNNQAISTVTHGLVYEPLVTCRGDRPAPGLAETWDTSPDGLRLSLKLKDGATWHDGRPVAPVDVQATFEQLLRSNTRQPLFRTWLRDVEAVEIAPDRTIRFRLLRPSRQALHALCEIPVLPALADRGTAAEKAQLARTPIGSGPFKVVGWERGHRIKLARNESYHGVVPHLGELWFEIDGDGARAMIRTKRGQIDILPQVLPVHFPEQLQPAALGPQLEVYRLQPLRFAYVVLNTRRDPLSDARFRWALSRLWQRERLAKELHEGLARPLGGPPFGETPATPFDRAAASAALDDAGYRDLNADGVRDRNGAPIRLTFLHVAGSKMVAKEAHQFALELRRAGVLLDVVALDPSTFMSRLREGDFDLAPLVWEGAPGEDPRASFGPDGVFNFGGYHSPQLQGLLDEWVLAQTPEARAELRAKLAHLLATETPAIFLYRFDTLALVSKRVRGLAAEGDRFDYRQVWLTEGRDDPGE
ncbi:MAG: hypothetical protein KA712_22560 [Myxococcales bacterium]|nr:hypothetical protein [Myxococcales bacterium]